MWNEREDTNQTLGRSICNKRILAKIYKVFVNQEATYKSNNHKWKKVKKRHFTGGHCCQNTYENCECLRWSHYGYNVLSWLLVRSQES